MWFQKFEKSSFCSLLLFFSFFFVSQLFGHAPRFVPPRFSHDWAHPNHGLSPLVRRPHPQIRNAAAVNHAMGAHVCWGPQCTPPSNYTKCFAGEVFPFILISILPTYGFFRCPWIVFQTCTRVFLIITWQPWCGRTSVLQFYGTVQCYWQMLHTAVMLSSNFLHGVTWLQNSTYYRMQFVMVLHYGVMLHVYTHL